MANKRGRTLAEFGAFLAPFAVSGAASVPAGAGVLARFRRRRRIYTDSGVGVLYGSGSGVSEHVIGEQAKVQEIELRPGPDVLAPRQPAWIPDWLSSLIEAVLFRPARAPAVRRRPPVYSDSGAAASVGRGRESAVEFVAVEQGIIFDDLGAAASLVRANGFDAIEFMDTGGAISSAMTNGADSLMIDRRVEVYHSRLRENLLAYGRAIEQGSQPPRKGTKTEYVARIDDLTRQVNRLEDEAVRRAIHLLQEAQREINRRIVTAEGWRLDNLQSLQPQIDEIFARFRRQYTAALTDIHGQVYALGVDSVDEPLKVSGVALAPARLNPSVVAVLQGFSADLIRRISDEARDTVNATLSRSLLGLLSPFEAQKQISQIIGAKDRLSELTGISARAESIFRTETGRVYSIATQARQEQVRELVPDLMKVWVATGDSRTRRDHLAAHGQQVGVDEFFEVGGEKLRFPRDPRGSAAMTINCRCRSVTWREGYGEAVPRTTARVEAEEERRANEDLETLVVG